MRNSRRRLPLLALLAGLLSGCGTVPFSPSACPPVVAYSPLDLETAADELEAIVAAGHVVIPQMIVDYGRERAMLRASQ